MTGETLLAGEILLAGDALLVGESFSVEEEALVVGEAFLVEEIFFEGLLVLAVLFVDVLLEAVLVAIVLVEDALVGAALVFEVLAGDLVAFDGDFVVVLGGEDLAFLVSGVLPGALLVVVADLAVAVALAAFVLMVTIGLLGSTGGENLKLPRMSLSTCVLLVVLLTLFSIVVDSYIDLSKNRDHTLKSHNKLAQQWNVD